MLGDYLAPFDEIKATAEHKKRKEVTILKTRAKSIIKDQEYISLEMK